ncbi:Bicarbonate transport ATP-binding protein CmpD [bacterium YEK0313]|nr:Bicarbonate transport ATP-binding protein CmpD [bacterium YEK0313]
MESAVASETMARPGAAPDGAPVSALSVQNVSMVFNRGETQVHALDHVSMDIRDGEFIAIVGPSGCGKSTLIKLVSGLRAPTAGRLAVRGRQVMKPRGDVGIVFQSPVLLPWRSILDNVMLPIDVLKQDRTTGRERALALLRLVGLGGFEAAYPNELSGGMQQRAAIARALVYDAPLLLMDEPFGALDALTREQMNSELQRIWQASGKTILFITHSIPEAVFLADRIVVMSPRPGRVLKIIANPIPRMRTLDDMLRPEFGALVREIRGLLGGHVAGGENHGTRAEW